MSRIDNATLQLTTAVGGALSVFAVNYNVLRIVSGMGGLALRRNSISAEHKSKFLKNLLVNYIFATLSKCGKLLIVFATTLFIKVNKGTRLVAEPNGNNVENWTIRSLVSYRINSRIKVQRLNVSGLEKSLRYSLVPKSKIYRKIGYKRLQLSKQLKIQNKSLFFNKKLNNIFILNKN